MQQVYRLTKLLGIAGIIATFFAGAAAAEKRAHMFHGKVEAVDQNAETLTVKGEEVKGWMSAMTMEYKVDDAAVLKTVKPGDAITATVYDGDFVLHKVQVMPKRIDSKRKM